MKTQAGTTEPSPSADISEDEPGQATKTFTVQAERNNLPRRHPQHAYAWLPGWMAAPILRQHLTKGWAL